ncbi:MAG: GEVED domain-containing protein [Flavobacteriaceae bacterium]|nr:GEVED domain-containing protein [Flavobacteriaceae bacterium]
MVKNIKLLVSLLGFFLFSSSYSQQSEIQKPSWTATLDYRFVPSISDQIKDGTFVPADEDAHKKLGREKRWHGNKVVPGKGLPNGDDPLLYLQENVVTKSSRDPILTFETTSNTATPSDPTGEIGRDYYFASWNSSFRFFNIDGTTASPPASLSTLFGNDESGDPIALYDSEADRYIITSMGSSGLNFAISQTNDPILGGWHVYNAMSFGTDGQFPDYPKYSIWSDGYYCTTNTSANNLYVLERDKIIDGDPTASIQGFNAPQMITSGFASAQVLDITNDDHPAPGNATMVYMQDDAWNQVPTDHLKIWTINIDWDNSNNSSISTPYQLPTSSFTSVFDGGSFANLTQSSGPDIDAMQATLMNQAQFRKFPTHNSAVFNFVVDVLSGSDELAAVRWYELRQDADGEPWVIYQEGTYTAPDGRHAFGASMAMDIQGNIGMGYTSMSATAPITLRYTGRYANDPSGQMTIEENLIGQSNATNPNTRYADYAHMSVDPSNDKTFWFISEYFKPGRRDLVGTFQIAANYSNDIGVVSVDTPVSGLLSNSESVTVSIFNYGEDAVSNFDVSYQLDSGTIITETYSGTVESTETVQHTFSTTADLSTVGQTYVIVSYTSLSGDEDSSNDGITQDVQHLNPNDLGVTGISSPVSGTNLSATELVTIEITNFGGAEQSNFEVSYELNGELVTETVDGPLAGNSSTDYIFTQTADLSAFGLYEITATVNIENDSDDSNNSISVNINNSNCTPTGDLSYGDGFHLFQVGDINNNTGSGGPGYEDFTNLSTALEQGSTNDLTVTTGYGNQNIRVWIDFNDDFVFTLDEVVVDNYVIAPGGAAGSYTETMQLVVPDDATLGEHIMRAKTNWNAPVPDDACEETNYGETEDYIVNIVESLGIDDSVLANSEFRIISQDNNQFNISLSTLYNEDISFSVYNISGQVIVFNNISKNTDKYLYDLDMSYAAAGVYLVKMGNSSIGYRVGKIIVK